MTITILLIILSLILLYFGADWLVKGSSSLSIRLGVSPLVTGLTIVALGTSAPELVVSINAALSGSSGLVFGNVVGSNIFNIGMILGIAALICPLQINNHLLKWDMPAVIGAAVVFTLFAWDGYIGRIAGAICMLLLIIYTLFLIRHARQSNEEGVSAIHVYKNAFIDIALIVIGLALLVWGSDLLVENATTVARALNVSETIIGLTIVAAGTSMPELATSAVAAYKKNPDIALGNIVGSNIYNLMAIAGCSAIIQPIRLTTSGVVDLLMMVFLTILIFPLMRTGYRMDRREGAFLIIIYLGYLAYLIMQATA